MPASDADDFTALSDLTQKVAAGRGGWDGGGDDGRRVPVFLHKLYNLVEEQEINLISSKLLYHDKLFQELG